MNKLLKITFLSMFCLVVLAGCGKKDETPSDTQDTANVGNLLNQNDINGANCPGNYDPVCSDTKHTYKNACFAEAASEKAWQPGEC